MQIGSRWFNVAYGEVPSAASVVRVTLGDGTVRRDAGFREEDGLWIVVIPGGPTDARTDIERIEVLSEDGLVLTSEDPPSLVEYRKQAANAAVEESAERHHR
ncbi:MAG: hypothetical protein ACRDKT_05815 [Actinomycetota bacterium]